MRSTGSLLVRALAVGGLTAAAWLISGAVASAAPADHSDGIAGTPEAVKTALASFHQRRDEALSAFDRVPQAIHESWTTALADTVVTTTVHTLAAAPSQPGVNRPLTQSSYPLVPAPSLMPAPSLVPATDEATEESSETEPPRDSYSGGSYSSSTMSGSVSNTVSVPMMAAKLEAKAAAKLAAAAVAAPAAPAPAPETAPATTPVTSTVDPQWFARTSTTTTPISIEDVDVESYTELDWEVPSPSAPAPSPQPISAPAAPTASSSGHDNSGGARGALAVTTAQSSLHPAATWSVERRDDGRTPGSEQGLPSTSPD